MAAWYLRDILYVQSPNIKAAVKHHLQNPDMPHMSLCAVAVIDKKTATEMPGEKCGTCVRMAEKIEKERAQRAAELLGRAIERIESGRYLGSDTMVVDRLEWSDMKIVVEGHLNSLKRNVEKK